MRYEVKFCVPGLGWTELTGVYCEKTFQLYGRRHLLILITLIAVAMVTGDFHEYCKNKKGLTIIHYFFIYFFFKYYFRKQL